MGSDNTTHRDEAAELHADVVRRAGRAYREDTRRMAIIFDRRGWPADRICEALELQPDTLDRMLAVDGRVVCTDCAYEMHHACARYRATSDGVTQCFCDCPDGLLAACAERPDTPM